VIKAIVIFRNMFCSSFLEDKAPKNQDSSNNEIISTIDRWLKNDGVIGAQRPQLIRPTVILDSQSPSSSGPSRPAPTHGATAISTG
jgi:hypothetical protein